MQFQVVRICIFAPAILEISQNKCYTTYYYEALVQISANSSAKYLGLVTIVAILDMSHAWLNLASGFRGEDYNEKI